jgi:hypothetical protein
VIKGQRGLHISEGQYHFVKEQVKVEGNTVLPDSNESKNI